MEPTTTARRKRRAWRVAMLMGAALGGALVILARRSPMPDGVMAGDSWPPVPLNPDRHT
jgi:hypothetical protein